MTNPFQAIVTYEEDSWEDYLSQILLIDIFMPVIKEYEDKQVLKSVIRYIAYAYSHDSDKIILGEDWHKNKKQIFEFVMIKPESKSYEDLVLLKNKAVIDAIHNWLSFQERDTFTQMQMLKDLRVEMQISAVSSIKKSSGEIDYSQKYLNATYANELKKMIKDLESELIQNDTLLREAAKEVRQARKTSDSRSVGSYAVR
jgi:hypothetical protein